MRSFAQVDVFTATALKGNPVAVVLDADGMSDEEMARFANWTNLSETTFVVPPTTPEADYRVRIFTPSGELPFAGHPTIGTCHAWLEFGGQPADHNGPGEIVQECGVGLVTLRQTDGRLAFAAPPLIRSGPVDESDLAAVCAVLQIERSEIIGHQWADNGPGWLAVQLADAEAVLALTPDYSAGDAFFEDVDVAAINKVGVVGPHPLGVVGMTNPATAPNDTATANEDPLIEVRAFFRTAGTPTEDPVTGSLNAAVAEWLLADGTLTAPYVASQGTALGRAGRVFIDQADGEIWVGGHAVTCITGTTTI